MDRRRLFVWNRVSMLMLDACGAVRLLEGETAWESSLLASATASGHATRHAAALEVEATSTSSTSTSHAAAEHLHEDFRVDTATHSSHATHATAAAEHISRIDEISARIVSLTFPVGVLVG